MVTVPDDDPRMELRGGKKVVATAPIRKYQVIGLYEGETSFEAEQLLRTNVFNRAEQEYKSFEFGTFSELKHQLHRDILKDCGITVEDEGDVVDFKDPLIVNARNVAGRFEVRTISGVRCSDKDMQLTLFGRGQWCAEINDYRLDPYNINAKIDLEREPNVIFAEVQILGWPYMFLVANQDIPRGSELLLDYGIAYWKVMRTHNHDQHLINNLLRPIETTVDVLSGKLEAAIGRQANLGSKADQIISLLNRMSRIAGAGNSKGTKRKFEVESEEELAHNATHFKEEIMEVEVTLKKLGELLAPIEHGRLRSGLSDDPTGLFTWLSDTKRELSGSPPADEKVRWNPGPVSIAKVAETAMSPNAQAELRWTGSSGSAPEIASPQPQDAEEPSASFAELSPRTNLRPPGNTVKTEQRSTPRKLAPKETQHVPKQTQPKRRKSNNHSAAAERFEANSTEKPTQTPARQQATFSQKASAPQKQQSPQYSQDELTTTVQRIFLPIIEDIMATDIDRIFCAPVDPKALPDYPKIITKPMDLGTIHKKLLSNEYKDGSQVVGDLLLMFDNCQKYNPAESFHYLFGGDLKNFSVKKLAEGVMFCRECDGLVENGRCAKCGVKVLRGQNAFMSFHEVRKRLIGLKRGEVVLAEWPENCVWYKAKVVQCTPKKPQRTYYDVDFNAAKVTLHASKLLLLPTPPYDIDGLGHDSKVLALVPRHLDEWEEDDDKYLPGIVQCSTVDTVQVSFPTYRTNVMAEVNRCDCIRIDQDFYTRAIRSIRAKADPTSEELPIKRSKSEDVDRVPGTAGVDGTPKSAREKGKQAETAAVAGRNGTPKSGNATGRRGEIPVVPLVSGTPKRSPDKGKKVASNGSTVGSSAMELSNDLMLDDDNATIGGSESSDEPEFVSVEYKDDTSLPDFRDEGSSAISTQAELPSVMISEPAVQHQPLASPTSTNSDAPPKRPAVYYFDMQCTHCYVYGRDKFLCLNPEAGEWHKVYKCRTKGCSDTPGGKASKFLRCRVEGCNTRDRWQATGNGSRGYATHLRTAHPELARPIKRKSGLPGQPGPNGVASQDTPSANPANATGSDSISISLLSSSPAPPSETSHAPRSPISETIESSTPQPGDSYPTAADTPRASYDLSQLFATPIPTAGDGIGFEGMTGTEYSASMATHLGMGGIPPSVHASPPPATPSPVVARSTVKSAEKKSAYNPLPAGMTLRDWMREYKDSDDGEEEEPLVRSNEKKKATKATLLKTSKASPLSTGASSARSSVNASPVTTASVGANGASGVGGSGSAGGVNAPSTANGGMSGEGSRADGKAHSGGSNGVTSVKGTPKTTTGSLSPLKRPRARRPTPSASPLAKRRAVSPTLPTPTSSTTPKPPTSAQSGTASSPPLDPLSSPSSPPFSFSSPSPNRTIKEECRVANPAPQQQGSPCVPWITDDDGVIVID
ncbi:hypothetical protein HK104_010986 [Borealophlyctis nickersoniae]|nr:hypothetical protein HK104_010986 [Borealophlyctis nickersoniae]